jgi:hypothetical protein
MGIPRRLGARLLRERPSQHRGSSRQVANRPRVAASPLPRAVPGMGAADARRLPALDLLLVALAAGVLC